MFIYLSTQSWVITDLFCMQPYFFLPNSDLRSRAQLEVADPDFTSMLLLNSQLVSLFPFPVLSSSDIGIVFLLNSAFAGYKLWFLEQVLAFERFNLLVLMADFPASSLYLVTLRSFEKMQFQHIFMDIGRRWHRSRFQKSYCLNSWNIMIETILVMEDNWFGYF